jgi:hypothetical protein
VNTFLHQHLNHRNRRAVFSTWSAPRDYQLDKFGGGVEYLHRDPASRRRRREGSLKSETVIFGRESQGTRTRE